MHAARQGKKDGNAIAMMTCVNERTTDRRGRARGNLGITCADVSKADQRSGTCTIARECGTAYLFRDKQGGRRTFDDRPHGRLGARLRS